MKKAMKSFVAFLLAGIMLITVGAAAETSAQKTKDKEVLYVAVNQKIDVIDGSNGNGLATQVMLHVGDPLTRCTIEGGIEPCLALSWEAIDEFTWQFKLRPDVKFTNGEDFNAEAVKVTIDYISSYFRYSSQIGNSWPITATVVDELTINLSTPEYCPDMPSLLARVPIFAPKQYAEEGDEVFFTHTVCTGPYKIESFDPGLSCTVVANEDYWNGVPQIKKIVFDWVSDQNARVAGLRAGDYDFVYVAPLSEIESLREEGFVVDVYGVVGIDMMLWTGNSTNEWIHNQQFRQACELAIDDEAIKDFIMGGYTPVLAGIADTTTFGATETWSLSYDVDKAQSILKEIGYDGTPLRMTYFTGEFSNQDEVCEAIAAYLEAAGIAVEINVVEEAAFNDMSKSGEVDIFAQRMPGPYYGGSRYYVLQMKTASRHNSDTFDDVMEMFNKTNEYGLSSEEREQIFKDMNALYWDKVPVIWGVHEVASNGLTSDLRGVENYPNSFCMFYNCYFED